MCGLGSLVFHNPGQNECDTGFQWKIFECSILAGCLRFWHRCFGLGDTLSRNEECHVA